MGLGESAGIGGSPLPVSRNDESFFVSLISGCMILRRAFCVCKGRAQHGQAAAMIPDENPPHRSETERSDPLPRPANDNGRATAGSIDPRILVIARAIGRQMALEQLDNLQAANDARPEDEC
jgi:hypothetical protein